MMSLPTPLVSEILGGRTRVREREVGRSRAELPAAGEQVVWRHLTHHSFRVLPRLLHKEIPAEPPARDLETLPEPAGSTYSLSFP